MTPAGFPHSDTPGSTLGCQLPRAYRRLLRPSSALDAKASTMCPSQLVTHTTNPTHPPQQKRPHPHPPEGETKRSLTKSQQMNQTWQCTQHTTKMLASTIQISNNNPTPTTGPPTGRPTTGRVLAPSHSPPPPTTSLRTRGRVGLIPQNPNSVPPPTRPGTTRPRRHQPARPRGPSTLASSEPDPGRGMSMIPLVNTTTNGATRTVTHRGACSLERR